MFETLFKYPLDTIRSGELVFLTRLPLELYVLALVVAAGAMWLLYRRMSGKVRPARRGVLLGLRVAFVAVLLFMLAMPAIQTTRSRNVAAFTAVVLDTSSSMSIADVEAAKGISQKLPRIEAAKAMLLGHGSDAGLVARLGEQSKLVLYGFDRDSRRLSDLRAVRADGAQTNVFRAIRDVDAELRGVPLAAVVLISDGGSTVSGSPSNGRSAGGSLDEAAAVLKSRGVPLFTVGIGNPNPPRDYEVSQVLAPKRVRRNSEVEVQANIRNTGFSGPFTVRIARGQTVLVSKTVQPPEGIDLHKVRMSFTPDHEGAATYRLAVAPADGPATALVGAEPAAARRSAVTSEAVTTNNSRDFTIEIQDDRLPVLYIEGSPRLEYRFLRRALFRDKDFRLVGLLRLAKDRFYVQGANDAEKYLEKGFPQTADQLYAFQAVILGDIEAGCFTPEQLQLLEEFARVRGGGVIMLGGVNSMGLGKYALTPVARMLPLEVSPADPPYSDEQYKARVTDEGLKHPVMQLVSDPVANRKLWESAPPLIGITPAGSVKAGAQLLITQENGTRAGLPVLAVQNYGQGRVAAFTSGGSWYWQMSAPASDEFHEKFWKQLVRWLVVGAREQLTVETDAESYSKQDPVILKATVLARDLKPVNDATVLATITDPLGNRQELPMDWILSQEGVYQCRYVAQEEGSYQVRVRVEGRDDFLQKSVASEFGVSEPVIEFLDSAMKESSLANMAKAAGGRYFRLADVGELPGEIAKAAELVRQSGARPIQRQIWDMPILLAMLVVLAGTEWFLRRRSGLA